MTLQILFALYPLCLAGAALVWTLTASSQRGRPLVLGVAVGGSIVAFAFLTGPWAYTSFYLRYVLLGLFTLVVLCAYRRVRLRGREVRHQSGGRLAFSTTILVLFSVLDVAAVASHLRPREILNLSFPLSSGTYYVLRGGNNAVSNPFHALSGSEMALDIVRLNTFGNRASGIAPRALEAYEIYGDPVHSPCEGTVLGVRDGLPDTVPGNPDAEHPEGNYIVLKCSEAEVLLAHLKQRSVAVVAGQTAAPGQLLGKVGNSGNSLEPHLHLGALRNGREIGLLLSTRWLSVNSVMSAKNRDAQPVAPADTPDAVNARTSLSRPANQPIQSS